VTDPTDPSGPIGPAAEPLGYAEAMAELDLILRELEDGEVDIDRLADQVRRAAELVRLCRGRLTDARTEVTRIVAQLDDQLDHERDEVRDAADHGAGGDDLLSAASAEPGRDDRPT
jgi:exodeoxyribonuclease VII small subunit